MVEADEYERAGVPPGLAHRVAGLATMFSTFDIVEVAADAAPRGRGGRRRLLQARRAARAALAARPHRRAPARRPLARAGPGRAARRPVQPAPGADRRGAARHGLEGVGHRAVDGWVARNPASERCLQTLAEIRLGHVFDTTTLPVAVREVRNLLLASGRS